MSVKVKKPIYRVGDKIRIINPEILERVGYNLTPKIVKETMMTGEDRNKIYDLLKHFKLIDDTGYFVYSPKDKLVKKIEDVIAYGIVGREDFGGRDKKIFTKYNELYKNQIFRVVDKSYVKTGKYYGPSGGYDSWTGEYDWAPGGLSNMKTHVILHLTEPETMIWSDDSCIKIEQIHVEKV